MERIDPDVLRVRYVELGTDWADKDAAANLLEESKKSVLAELLLNSDGKSVAEREAIALASQGYRQHVTKMVEARRVANRARVNLDAARAWFDLARTVEATNRAEMGLK
jgi:hypothetical protein